MPKGHKTTHTYVSSIVGAKVPKRPQTRSFFATTFCCVPRGSRIYFKIFTRANNKKNLARTFWTEHQPEERSSSSLGLMIHRDMTWQCAEVEVNPIWDSTEQKKTKRKGFALLSVWLAGSTALDRSKFCYFILFLNYLCLFW